MSHKMIQLTINDELQSQNNTEEKRPRSSKLQFNDVWYSTKESMQYINTAGRLNRIVSLTNSSRKTEQIHRKGNMAKHYSLIRLGIETNLFSSGLENETAQDLAPDTPPIVENKGDSCKSCCHYLPEKKTGDLLFRKSNSCPEISNIPALVSVKARVPLASELELTNTMVTGSSDTDEFKTQPNQSVRVGSETCNVGNYKQISLVLPMSFRYFPDPLVNKSKDKPEITDEVLDTCVQSKEFESLHVSNEDAKLGLKDPTRDILFKRSISYESLRKETMQEIIFSSDAITPAELTKYSAKTSGDTETQDDVCAPLLPTILSDPLVSEFWRLATFQDAVDVPVFVQRLAQSGFYYDKQLNDIRCFSCGVSKRHWQQWERPALIHLHLSPLCPHANSRDSSNIPITTMYQPRVTCQTKPDTTSSSDQSRLTGDHRNDSVTSMHNPTVTEKEQNSSSTYSNSSNSTRLCSENTGSASVTSSAGVVSPSLSANPRIVPSLYDATEVTTQLEQASYPHEEERTDVEQALEEGHAHRAELVASDSSLSRPTLVNPCDVNFSQRLLTFTSWSNSTASPTELAAAGFSYLGTGDSVRCFCCALTLKNWTGDLTPWVAHVVYRSSCDYILSVKGEDFVKTTLVTFGRAQHKTGENSSRTQTHEATFGVRHVSDTREAAAPSRKLQAVAADGDVSSDSGSFTSDFRPVLTYSRMDAEAGSWGALADTSRHLREILTCRQCRHREVDTLVLPCGHLCACSACASDMTQCLVCLQTVMATVLVQRE